MGMKEKAQDLFFAAAEQVPNVVSDLFLHGVLGSMVPGVTGAVLAYQQRRQERMYEAFMVEVKEKMALLDARLNRLSRESLQDFRDKYFGMVSDYVLEEVQEAKIQYLVTGFVNLAGMEKVQEDFVLSYYDTLRDLRMQDIAVLNYASIPRRLGQPGETIREFQEKTNLDLEQYYAVKEKLKRMGLLVSRQDENLDKLYKNLEQIQDYLKNLNQGKKPNLGSFSRLEKRDAFQVSKYGKDFLRFFTDLDYGDNTKTEE